MTAWTGGPLPTLLAGEIVSADKMYVILDALDYALDARVRIATDRQTTDSSTYTAETSLQEVTADLVANAVYNVRISSHIGTSVANDVGSYRIREGSGTGGQELQIRPNVTLPNAGVAGNMVDLDVEYIAASTGAQTFTFTGIRNSGTGNHRREAQGDRPSTFQVDYVRG